MPTQPQTFRKHSLQQRLLDELANVEAQIVRLARLHLFANIFQERFIFENVDGAPVRIRGDVAAGAGAKSVTILPQPLP